MTRSIFRARLVAISLGVLLSLSLGDGYLALAQTTGTNGAYFPISLGNANTWTAAQVFAGNATGGQLQFGAAGAYSAPAVNRGVLNYDTAGGTLVLDARGGTTSLRLNVSNGGTDINAISIASSGAVTVQQPTAATALTVNGASGQLAVNASQPIGLPAFTVATLPTCNTTLKGGMAYVTDASSPTYNATLTGGSSTIVPVFCNGSAWTAH